MSKVKPNTEMKEKIKRIAVVYNVGETDVKYAIGETMEISFYGTDNKQNEVMVTAILPVWLAKQLGSGLKNAVTDYSNRAFSIKTDFISELNK